MKSMINLVSSHDEIELKALNSEKRNPNENKRG